MTSHSPIPVLAALRRTPIPIILACTPWIIILGWLTAISWFQATDDAFISFRYARNLIEGHGLVFNVGERVEGYSNFLWTIELAAIWRALGIPPEDAAPWLSTAFTVATLAAMIWWVARLPCLHHRNLVIWMSLGLICTSATFAVWTSAGGLETRQFTFFIVLAVVLLTTYRNSRAGLLAASTSLALASLTRPEGALIAASCFAWYALQSIADTADAIGEDAPSTATPGVFPTHHLARIRSLAARIPRRELLCLIAPFAVLVGAHLIFRFAYYGEWLPNTYYAKYTGPWYDMGILYLTMAALDTGLYLLLPLAGVGIWSRWRAHRGDLAFVLPLMCIIPHMRYLMQIGGDVFEYRPLDFYWPLLAVPASAGIVWLGGAIASRARRIRTFAWESVVASSSAWTLLLFVPVVIYANAVQGTLLYRGAAVPGSRIISDPEFDVRSVGWLLAVPGVHALVGASNLLHTSAYMHDVALSASVFRVQTGFFLDKWGPYQRAWRGVLPDDAVMLTGSGGILPYSVPDLTIVDDYGLTDKTTARSTLRRVGKRRMAHERIPPPGYPEERGVNFILHRAQTNAADALEIASYAVQVGANLWMPFDTHDHHWAHDNFTQHGLLTRHIDLDALIGGHEPIIDSRYDVYHIEDDLIYVNAQCDSHYDLAATFFLHLFPTDPRDLPRERAEYGFQNWGFTFRTGQGSSADGTCVATRQLPEYEIAAIRTGQYLFDYASEDTAIWKAEFRSDGQ